MNIFSNIFVGGMSVGTYLISACLAIACGALVAIASCFRSRVSKSYFASLIVLPLAVHFPLSDSVPFLQRHVR